MLHINLMILNSDWNNDRVVMLSDRVVLFSDRVVLFSGRVVV